LVALCAGDPIAVELKPGREIVIGRDHGCNMVVPDHLVSRRHLKVRVSEARVPVITDLGSRNGTSLAGGLVPPMVEVPVHRGDSFTVGTTTIVVLGRPGHIDSVKPSLDEAIADLVARDVRATVLCVQPKEGSPLRLGAFEQWLQGLLGPDDLLLSEEGTWWIVVRGSADVQSAVRTAASLYLDRLEIVATIGEAIVPTHGRSAQELRSYAQERLRMRLRVPLAGGPIIADDSMRELYQLVDQVAQSPLSVLLLGETGAGKEVLAREIHRRSSRSSGPFVAINCAGIPESLLESELFGYVAGAFTGADRAKEGLLVRADRGTLLLDELGEMPASIQPRLLRALELKEVHPLGSLEPRPIDVRLVSATNVQIEERIAAGTFRSDLYYRINGISLTIPPLRSRWQEILPLAERFAREAKARLGLAGPPALTSAATERILQYSWPGNVRELKNVIERATVLAGEKPIDVHDLRLSQFTGAITGVRRSPLHTKSSAPPTDGEEARIRTALEQAGGNQTKAAELLGMSRKALLHRLDRYQIPRPRLSGR
jgi:two-component system, NtrC family, response regulator AtoC